jgi:inorganic pyrophosphatase
MRLLTLPMRNQASPNYADATTVWLFRGRVKRMIPFAILLIDLMLVAQASASQQLLNTDQDNSPQDQVALIEIPAGTNQKWEQNKYSGQVEWEMRDGIRRVVNYLPYPGNYGMIENTLLPKDRGGDGDPLDVIVLGPAVDRGSRINIRIIGILKLEDNGEQDDKLIAVMDGSPFDHVNSIAELQRHYLGVDEILRLWFSHYKGPGQMKFVGFADRLEALDVLRAAHESFLSSLVVPGHGRVD